MPPTPKGEATLRLAICGTGANTLDVTVNGKPAGKVERLTGDGTITRHVSQGIWYERTLSFDAGLMQAGSDTLTLTVPAGPVNNGLMYDYISLELAELKKLVCNPNKNTPSIFGLLFSNYGGEN